MFTKTNCLSSLIGIRTGCSTPEDKPFYIEDVEGLDIQNLAKLATVSESKGANAAQWLITSAAREMMGDLELLMNPGYSLRGTMGDVCSSCNLLPVYTSNTGIIIKSATSSRYSLLHVTKLIILANVTGTKTLIFDDGKTQETFDVELESGVLMPILFDYKTAERSIKVYFEDTTIGLGQISCATTSSCGCGGTATQAPIVIGGLVGGSETVVQYGFLACAGIVCSNDSLICGLIQKSPNIFGLALLYKIGEKFTVTKAISQRNNNVVSYEDGEQAQEVQKRYGQLYWAKMKGQKGARGITHYISDYLRTNAADKCVQCDAKIYTAYATG